MLSILLVEDDEADSLLIKLTLKKAGLACQITNAKTLAEAQTLLAAGKFDCALLDNALPDGTGLALLKVLGAMPCIMLTGLADEQYAIQAMQSGLEDYLVKDTITPTVLSKAIKYAIERNHLKQELIATKNKLEEITRTDPLTGAMNRRGLDDILNRLSSRGETHGILLVDVDNFKTINDSFGYTAGDLALQHVAAILRQEVRPLDLVARVGGDEFIVLIQNVRDLGECTQVAERIRATIAAKALDFQPIGFNITVSLGVATTNVKTKSTKEILKLTQNALKQSKKGKNTVYA